MSRLPRIIVPLVAVLLAASALSLVLPGVGAQRAAPGAGPRYVRWDASGADDGSSWADAYTDLADALSAAVPGSEIWVATGVYTPGALRAASFVLPEGVSLYGGFSGTETGRDQRDWEAHPTVLSGDIGGDDLVDARGVVTVAAHIVGDNAYHVVSTTGVTETAVLDGFIITGGQATGASAQNADRGGGTYNFMGGPTVANVTFAGNVARLGGGMLTVGANGMALSNVTFSGNAATDTGGADPATGGGLANQSCTHVTLEGVTFVGNSATAPADRVSRGGGMANLNSPNVTLIDVAFLGNSVSGSGASHSGGLFIYQSNHVALTGAIFRENACIAPEWGFGAGLVVDQSQAVTVTNALIYANAAYAAAGVLLSDAATALVNVTVAGNTGSLGPAITLFGGTVAMTNGIVWGHSNPAGAIDNQGYVSVSHSIVEAGCPVLGGGASYCVETLNSDPRFVDAARGDLHLGEDSPAIDAGDNAAVTVTTDLDGNRRIVDGDGDEITTVDMGGYEWMPTYRVYLPLALR